MIKLLWNPEASFDEIYCAPDFATGAFLINEEEVKESLQNGTGKACKLRSKIEYNEKERCFIITEIPYGVYTSTINGQLLTLIEEQPELGIERFLDLSGEKPLIKIYVTKKANLRKVLNTLYKETSLEYYYGINMTMLDNGKVPKIFTWKEALLAHIEHEKKTYRKIFNFDLAEISRKLHIVEGILIAIDYINEIIETIKKSKNRQEAINSLTENFPLTEIQAKAILEIKLAKLSNLEVTKYKEEKAALLAEKLELEKLLSDENSFKLYIEKKMKEVINKFGDNRRTEVISLSNEEELIEEKQVLYLLTNKNNFIISDIGSFSSQKRGGVGTKSKLDTSRGEVVIKSFKEINTAPVIFLSNDGKYYKKDCQNLPHEEKISINSLFPLAEKEEILAIAPYKENSVITIITKEGLMKKSYSTEYSSNRIAGAKAIKLEKGDSINSIIVSDNHDIGLLTFNGNFLIISQKEVTPIGRVAKGVKAIKMSDGDFLVTAKEIRDDNKEIFFITKDGYIKRVSKYDFSVSNRYTKGVKVLPSKDTSKMASFLPIEPDSKEILIISSANTIKIKKSEIPLLARNTKGIKSMKLKEKNEIKIII